MQSMFCMLYAKSYVPRTLKYLHIYCTLSNQKLGDCNVCLSLQDAYPPPQGGINRRSRRRGKEGKEKGTFCSDLNDAMWTWVVEENGFRD